jgi:hypothetical protein
MLIPQTLTEGDWAVIDSVSPRTSAPNDRFVKSFAKLYGILLGYNNRPWWQSVLGVKDPWLNRFHTVLLPKVVALLSSPTPPSIPDMLSLPDGTNDNRWMVYFIIIVPNARGKELGLLPYGYVGSTTAPNVFNDDLKIVVPGGGEARNSSHLKDIRNNKSSVALD